MIDPDIIPASCASADWTTCPTNYVPPSVPGSVELIPPTSSFVPPTSAVVQSWPELPNTGGPWVTILLVGIALFAAGVALIWMGRRQTRAAGRRR